MQHPDEGTIHAWLDGALSADEAARVEAHVKDCQQCQASVAEARGFIAASSRILTALDDAPRGVIPAAAPKKRIDPMVWRIAATVVVVATGTFFVLKSGSVERAGARSAITATSQQQSEAASAPASMDSITTPRSIADRIAAPRATGAPNESSSIAEKSAVKAPAAIGAVGGAPALRKSAPQVLNRTDQAAPSRADIAQRRDLAKTPAQEQNFSAGAAVALPAPPSAVAAQKEAQSRAADAVGLSAKMDPAAGASPALRVVGTPRAIGQKITHYEITPGDTVTLVEPMNVSLSAAVVTGLGKARAAQVPADGKRERAVETQPAASNQNAAASAAPVAPAPAPPPVPSFTEGVDGKNTLTWRDPRTGLINRLTGRHTRAELEQIKIRIERERAAPAADSAKKR